MMKNDELELEWVRLSMLFVPEELVASVLGRPYGEIGLRWVVENHALALTCHRHFEGCYLFGSQEVIDQSIKRIQAI